MCISPRRNAISASNKFRHAQLSAPSFLHLLQFGHRGFRQVFVLVDESPLPHLAIKNQVRTPGMQTLWHDFFAGRPCGIYCACVRFELFSVSCDIPHKLSTILGHCFVKQSQPFCEGRVAPCPISQQHGASTFLHRNDVLLGLAFVYLC